jgi:hypothetical protein
VNRLRSLPRPGFAPGQHHACRLTDPPARHLTKRGHYETGCADPFGKQTRRFRQRSLVPVAQNCNQNSSAPIYVLPMYFAPLIGLSVEPHVLWQEREGPESQFGLRPNRRGVGRGMNRTAPVNNAAFASGLSRRIPRNGCRSTLIRQLVDAIKMFACHRPSVRLTGCGRKSRFRINELGARIRSR